MNPGSYTYKLSLTFRAKADADVIAALEAAPNTTEFVRQAIREKIAKAREAK